MTMQLSAIVFQKVKPTNFIIRQDKGESHKEISYYFRKREFFASKNSYNLVIFLSLS